MAAPSLAEAQPLLPPTYVSPFIDVAAFREAAAAAAAALRAAVPPAADPEADAAVLGLSTLRAPRLDDAVRQLLRGGGGGGQPQPPPAEALAGLRSAHAAALRRAPLASLRELGALLAADRRGVGSQQQLGRRARPPPPPPPPEPAGAAAEAAAAADAAARPLAAGEAVLTFTLREWPHPGRPACAPALTVALPACATLAALRDALAAPGAPGGCASERAAAALGCRSQGAYFLIEGVFYSDLRGGATDLAAPLRGAAFGAGAPGLDAAGHGARSVATEDGHPGEAAPAATPAAPGGPACGGRLGGGGSAVGAVDMASVALASLRLRVGARYPFAHQGSCEHSVSCDGVRAHVPRWDAPSLRHYPLPVACARRVARRCGVCDTFAPSVVVHGSPLAPESPCLLCASCHARLHFDQDGVTPVAAGFDVVPVAT